jgi:hypothetical protein
VGSCASFACAPGTSDQDNDPSTPCVTLQVAREASKSGLSDGALGGLIAGVVVGLLLLLLLILFLVVRRLKCVGRRTATACPVCRALLQAQAHSHTHIYIYIYIHIQIHMYIYIYALTGLQAHLRTQLCGPSAGARGQPRPASGDHQHPG